MQENYKYKSDFLFSNSSFWSGFGSSFNLAGNFYNFNTSKSEKEADNKAIRSDWSVVGENLNIAFLRHLNKTNKKLDKKEQRK